MKYFLISAVAIILMSCSNESVEIERDEFECLDNSEFRKLTKETKKIEVDDIDSLYTKVIMGAGRLIVNGKTKHLFAGSFAYNHEDFAPRVKYYREENKGTLKVIPKQFNEDSQHDDIENVWNLRFNEDIPTKMDLKFGAGLGKINLGELNLYKGILKLGAGKIDINLSNNNSLEKLIIKMGVGDVKVDISELQKNDCKIIIKAGIGKLTLAIPEDKNTDIHVNRGIAKVTASGLKKSGDHYYNSVNDNKESLRIEVDAGLGHIEIVKGKILEEQLEEVE